MDCEWNKEVKWNEDSLKLLVSDIKADGFDGNFQRLEDKFGKNAGSLRYLKETIFSGGSGSDSAPFDVELNGVNAAFDGWIEPLRSNRHVQRCAGDVALMMASMAHFSQDIPTPERENQVDFKSIYGALASLMQGHVPKQLNARTATTLDRVIRRFNEIVQHDPSNDDEVSLLASVKVPCEAVLTAQQKNDVLRQRRRKEWIEEELQDRRKVLSSDMAAVQEFYNRQPGLNPLRFQNGQNE